MEFEVCCLGHLCMDVLAKTVDVFPPKGKLASVDSITQSTGGCAMNTALGLAKLGVHTAFIGKVGDDAFGVLIRKALEDNGVDTSGLIIEEGGVTSSSFLTIASDGERTILHCYGTNATLSADDVDMGIIKRSRILFLGGTFLMPGFDGENAKKILCEAKKAGVLTVMDTAWDVSGGWLKTIQSNLSYLDWFMPSIEEAEQLFGTRDVMELSKIIKQYGVKNVVIKMGSDGCYIEPDGEEGSFYTVFPVKSVDTAGAGDAWCAGFLSALVRGLSPKDAAIWGNAVGALCITRIGTTTGLLDYKGTEAFIAANS